MPVNGRLAAGNPEGSAALALGSFREFVRQLERLHADLARPKSPDEWRQTLSGAIDSFVAPTGDEIDDERETAAGIHELHASMTHGGMTEALGVDVVRTALTALLDDPTRGGMPGGAVTFAAMASLRNLPYRFVCAIGMNDGAFPSTQRPSEFDLMARDPRRGDRQRRVDERNVFLDLLLAARERLYLSYTGKSVRDNSPLPPSVLVAELLDYCAAAIDEAPFTPESLTKARQRLTVEHPLQPFSIDYFEPEADPRRRSFNDEYCAALKQQRAAPSAPPMLEPVAPGALAADVSGNGAGDDGESEDENEASEPQQRFFVLPLARAGPEFHEVTLDNLARFFRNPCRYLLKERLGISLPEGDEELQDDEPFVSERSGARSACGARAAPPARWRRRRRAAHVRARRHRISAGAPRRSRAGTGAAAARPFRARARAGARGAKARSRRRDAGVRARRRAVAPDRRASATCARSDSSATATTTHAPTII